MFHVEHSLTQKDDLKYLWHPFTQMATWDNPLIIDRAQGVYLYDENGKEYIDGVSSLWANIHGHNHPKINEAIVAQLNKVAHTTMLGLAHEPSTRLAKILVENAPKNLSRVFYSDSGSTAVEIALKMAFQYHLNNGDRTRDKYIYVQQGYHGDTLGAVGVGGIPVFHQIFGPILRTGLGIPSPAPRTHPSRDPQISSAESLAALATLASRPDIAAFVLEPLVQGAGGILTHPQGYLAAAQKICKNNNVLLIVDEVATGFGRTGTLFACEQENVTPDFLCLAKGITGGYLPLSATLTTESIFEAFLGDPTKTFFHGHTYTGNPLACAAGIASMELFHVEQTLDNVKKRTIEMAEKLSDLSHDSKVSDVRQAGLMAGIELDGSSETAHNICQKLRDQGVIIRGLDNTLVVMPPLSITKDELNILMTKIIDNVTG